MAEKSIAIAETCAALTRGERAQAISLLKRDYPVAPNPVTKRQYGPVESTRVFIRDGFIDRYTGERLVFPPVLRLISADLPDDFPFHPNWKANVTHPAYWEVGATVDHLIPTSRGGADDESNWVSTSMARNSAKGNWTTESRKLFGFIPDSVFTFIPDHCSESSRIGVRIHRGIAFTFPRNPHNPWPVTPPQVQPTTSTNMNVLVIICAMTLRGPRRRVAQSPANPTSYA
jgi:5-methylcytosine-specific restriction endonuclease McrA